MHNCLFEVLFVFKNSKEFEIACLQKNGREEEDQYELEERNYMTVSTCNSMTRNITRCSKIFWMII